MEGKTHPVIKFWKRAGRSIIFSTVSISLITADYLHTRKWKKELETKYENFYV